MSHEPRAGEVAPVLAAELPGLRLRFIAVPGRSGPVGEAARGRLAELSDRRRGVDAVALRTRAIPRAYRAFARQVGLDPDRERTPAERIAVRGLLDGGLRARDRIEAACLIAVAETGVGVWALDGAAVAPTGPGIQLHPGEGGTDRGSGELVVADARAVHAPLLGDPLPASTPGVRTRSVVLYALGVAGVPEIHLHEALWQAEDALGAGLG